MWRHYRVATIVATWYPLSHGASIPIFSRRNLHNPRFHKRQPGLDRRAKLVRHPKPAHAIHAAATIRDNLGHDLRSDGDRHQQDVQQRQYGRILRDITTHERQVRMAFRIQDAQDICTYRMVAVHVRHDIRMHVPRAGRPQLPVHDGSIRIVAIPGINSEYAYNAFEWLKTRY